MLSSLTAAMGLFSQQQPPASDAATNIKETPVSGAAPDTKAHESRSTSTSTGSPSSTRSTGSEVAVAGSPEQVASLPVRNTFIEIPVGRAISLDSCLQDSGADSCPASGFRSVPGLPQWHDPLVHSLQGSPMPPADTWPRTMSGDALEDILAQPGFRPFATPPQPALWPRTMSGDCLEDMFGQMSQLPYIPGLETTATYMSAMPPPPPPQEQAPMLFDAYDVPPPPEHMLHEQLAPADQNLGYNMQSAALAELFMYAENGACRPQAAEFRPQAAEFRPQAAEFRPQAAEFRPQVAFGEYSVAADGYSVAAETGGMQSPAVAELFARAEYNGLAPAPVPVNLSDALFVPDDAVFEPKLGSADCPTMGSKGHGAGNCKPCAFLFTKGCANGLECTFCHLCEPGEKKRRHKEKKEARREAHTFRAYGRGEW